MEKRTVEEIRSREEWGREWVVGEERSRRRRKQRRR